MIDNDAHQPPASCAKHRCRPSATPSPPHRWLDTTDGKCTLPRDATQAPGYLERGAVAGRLHALVSALPSVVLCSRRLHSSTITPNPPRPSLFEIHVQEMMLVSLRLVLQTPWRVSLAECHLSLRP